MINLAKVDLKRALAINGFKQLLKKLRSNTITLTDAEIQAIRAIIATLEAR